MREIKFRKYNIIQEFMSDVDTLDLEVWNDKDERPSNIILMQFTGLKDKNGEDIYEGDIVVRKLNHHSYRIVEFKDGSFVGTDIIKNPRNIYNSYPFYANEDWEVIGNIYQTPELLNEQ